MLSLSEQYPHNQVVEDEESIIEGVHRIIEMQKIKAVIFDVDGTLYSLPKLYRKIYLALFRHYLSHPTQILDLWVLHHFLQAREHNATTIAADLEQAQYEWAAQSSHMPLERVKQVVNRWVLEAPIDYLYDCRHPEMIELFRGLTDRGIQTAVFSDYPAQAKLDSLGLSCRCIISSVDQNVNHLKPHPQGLQVAVEQLGVTMQECLFIGDRDDRDGACARQAGMAYLMIRHSHNNNLKWVASLPR